MKILIIDDHPLVRDAMAQIVAQLGENVEVFDAAHCLAGLEIAAAHPDIDLVLLDLNLPGLRGIAALKRFREEHPAAPVVIVSMYRDRDTVAEAIQNGAMGYIPKSAPRETVLNALRTVLGGKIHVPSECGWDDSPARDGLLSGMHDQAHAAGELRLTGRQSQVLALVMQGKSNKEICRELGLAERTVKVHMTAVLNALKVTSRTQAAIVASRLGLAANELLAEAEARQLLR